MGQNVKKDLFTAVKNALAAIKDDEDVRLINKVQHYNSQDFHDDDGIATNKPDAYIQISSIEWEPTSLKAINSNQTQEQKGVIELTVYLRYFSLDDDDNKYLTHLDLTDEVYRALTMLESTNFNPLQRTGEVDDVDNNNSRMWQITFQTMVTEQAVTLSQEDAAPVGLTIE